jgi:hypothetical protein
MKRILWLLAASFLHTFPAVAHHSSAVFDVNAPVNVSGVVTRMEWTNPHARLYVEARSEDGSRVEWEFELPAINRLLRLGWTRHAVNPGDRVTVVGARARTALNVALALNVLDASGRKLFVGSPTGAPAESESHPKKEGS